MNSNWSKMLLPTTQYDCEEVKSLIKRNVLNEALTYMLDFTERQKLSSFNFELIGCQGRLKNIEGDHRKEIINYDEYTLKRNRILYYLMELNIEIDKFDKSVRSKTLANNIKTIVGSALLLTLLFLLKHFCIDKAIQTYNGFVNNENDRRQYEIKDFYITKADCIDSTYAIIKIKNSGKKDLKDITFKWIPDINFPDDTLSNFIETLHVNETDSIKIPLENSIQYKPGRYLSSLEEDHPAPVFSKVYYNFEIKACKKLAVQGNLQKGDWVSLTYQDRYKKRIRLIGDSISLPINCTSFNIE